MIKYEPPYEELMADADLMKRGFVNKVRCVECNRRITWASDTEEKDGKPIYLTCICGKEMDYYTMEITGITYGEVAETWKEVFGDMFPLDNKPQSYIFERFINKLRARQFLKQEYKKQEARKEVKKK